MDPYATASDSAFAAFLAPITLRRTEAARQALQLWLQGLQPVDRSAEVARLVAEREAIVARAEKARETAREDAKDVAAQSLDWVRAELTQRGQEMGASETDARLRQDAAESNQRTALAASGLGDPQVRGFIDAAVVDASTRAQAARGRGGAVATVFGEVARDSFAAVQRSNADRALMFEQLAQQAVRELPDDPEGQRAAVRNIAEGLRIRDINEDVRPFLEAGRAASGTRIGAAQVVRPDQVNVQAPDLAAELAAIDEAPLLGDEERKRIEEIDAEVKAIDAAAGQMRTDAPTFADWMRAVQQGIDPRFGQRVRAALPVRAAPVEPPKDLVADLEDEPPAVPATMPTPNLDEDGPYEITGGPRRPSPRAAATKPPPPDEAEVDLPPDLAAADLAAELSGAAKPSTRSRLADALGKLQRRK